MKILGIEIKECIYLDSNKLLFDKTNRKLYINKVDETKSEEQIVKNIKTITVIDTEIKFPEVDLNSMSELFAKKIQHELQLREIALYQFGILL